MLFLSFSLSACFEPRFNSDFIAGGGETLSPLSPLADASHILAGKKAYDDQSTVITGTMPEGSDVSGSNALLSKLIPQGYYDGTKSCSMSDSNLVEGNIRSGTSIFEITGTLAAAYATCSDNGLNAAQCSTAPSRYVYTSAYGGRSAEGVNVVNGTNASHGTTVSASIPDAYYSAKTCSFTDANLLALAHG